MWVYVIAGTVCLAQAGILLYRLAQDLNAERAAGKGLPVLRRLVIRTVIQLLDFLIYVVVLLLVIHAFRGWPCPV